MSPSRTLRRVKARKNLSSDSQASQGVEPPPIARPAGALNSHPIHSQSPAGTGGFRGFGPSAQVASSQANANRRQPGLQSQPNCSPAPAALCQLAVDKKRPLHLHDSTLRVHGVLQIPDTIPNSRRPLSRSHISKKLACGNKLKKPQASPNHKSFWRRSRGIFRVGRTLGSLVLRKPHHSADVSPNSPPPRRNCFRGAPRSGLWRRTKSLFVKRSAKILNRTEDYYARSSLHRRRIPISNEIVPLMLSASWTSDEQSIALQSRWGMGWLGDLVDGWRVPGLKVQLARVRHELEKLQCHIRQLETDKAALVEYNTRKDADVSRLLSTIKSHEKQHQNDHEIRSDLEDMVEDLKAQLRVFDETLTRPISIALVPSLYQSSILEFLQADTTVSRTSRELFLTPKLASQTEASHRIPRVPVGRVRTYLPAARSAPHMSNDTIRNETPQQTSAQTHEELPSCMISSRNDTTLRHPSPLMFQQPDSLNRFTDSYKGVKEISLASAGGSVTTFSIMDIFLPTTDLGSKSPTESTPSLITDVSDNDESSPVGEVNHTLPMNDEIEWFTFTPEGKRIQACAPVYRMRIASRFREGGEYDAMSDELSRLDTWEWDSVPILELNMLAD